MWANMIYFMPIATMLSVHKVDEDVQLDGDLGTEVRKLVSKYITEDKLIFLVDPKLNATIHLSYPKDSNLWTIFDSILQRYHLLPTITTNEKGAVVVVLKEGGAWVR